EWQAHHPIALKQGLRREIADAIAEGSRPIGMAEDEEIAYDMATEILRLKRVSDSTYRRAGGGVGGAGGVAPAAGGGLPTFFALGGGRRARPAGRGGAAEPPKRYRE